MAKPYLIVTSEKVSKEYLDYLDRQNISWIACVKEHVDLARASLPFRHHAVTLCDRCVLCTGGEDYFSAQEKENGRLIYFPKISTQNKPQHSILCRGSYYVPL